VRRCDFASEGTLANASAARMERIPAMQ